MENFKEQSIQEIDRFLKKVVQKFTSPKEPTMITDIHLRISPESGDLMAFDDDENEVTRCVIEEWIDYKNENVYDSAALLLRNRIFAMSEEIDKLCLLKPYSFVLENEDNEHVAELYVVDDDLNIIGGDIMEGWDKDLDAFFSKLMEE